MNKFGKIAWIVLLWATIALAGCNTQQKQQVNSQSTTKTATTQKSSWKIVLYIDKNCEQAGIQQCNPNIWKAQFSQILGSWNKLDIEYINKDMAKKLRDIVGVSPVLVIPADKLSLFGPQAQAIKASAKQVDGSYYVPLYGWIPGEENLCNDWKDNNNDGKIDAQDPTCYKMIALTSKNCNKPYCAPQALKNMFMWYYVDVVDYNSTTWKKLYDKLVKINGKQYLPTFLFNKEHKYFDQMKQFIKELTGCKYKYQLNIPQFNYDPSIEACATNCNASSACKKLLTCNKTDKPTVELFVMSHCPFGTQAEKGIIPVVNLLKNKINFYVKFVDYSMHGKWEIDENTLQYCIQKEEPKKYIPYLTCFLEKWDTVWCEKKVWLDMNKINECIKKADKEFNIEKNYNDKTSWVSGRFPKYEVNEKGNLKYNVQGSPTLVINGVVVQPQDRSPESYLKLICSAFKNPPAECKKALSTKSYDPGFGWTQSWKPAPAGSCGGN